MHKHISGKYQFIGSSEKILNDASQEFSIREHNIKRQSLITSSNPSREILDLRKEISKKYNITIM